MIINVNKDSFQIDDIILKMPITKDTLVEVLGEFDDCRDECLVGIEYYYNDLGIIATFNKKDIMIDIRFFLQGCQFKHTHKCFLGNININGISYDKCSWILDDGIGELKVGLCHLYTVTDNDKIAMLGIEYKVPKVKSNTNKYKIDKLDIEEFKFSSFNLKLAVMQKLMYDEGLLLPKFDVYEFVEEYNKRDIDIDIEGYEPIKEVVNWFKKYQIPSFLASEVDRICMDGGNEIYHQIIPFWDGEDEYFDIKKITIDDIKQLPNLKKMILMSNNVSKIKKQLKDTSIEIEQL